MDDFREVVSLWKECIKLVKYHLEEVRLQWDPIEFEIMAHVACSNHSSFMFFMDANIHNLEHLQNAPLELQIELAPRLNKILSYYYTYKTSYNELSAC